jgi:hypothetical protein
MRLTVRLTDDTVGTLLRLSDTDIVGERASIVLRDENGMFIQKTGIVAEILEKEEAV